MSRLQLFLFPRTARRPPALIPASHCHGNRWSRLDQSSWSRASRWERLFYIYNITDRAPRRRTIRRGILPPRHWPCKGVSGSVGESERGESQTRGGGGVQSEERKRIKDVRGRDRCNITNTQTAKDEKAAEKSKIQLTMNRYVDWLGTWYSLDVGFDLGLVGLDLVYDLGHGFRTCWS